MVEDCEGRGDNARPDAASEQHVIDKRAARERRHARAACRIGRDHAEVHGRRKHKAAGPSTTRGVWSRGLLRGSSRGRVGLTSTAQHYNVTDI